MYFYIKNLKTKKKQGRWIFLLKAKLFAFNEVDDFSNDFFC